MSDSAEPFYSVTKKNTVALLWLLKPHEMGFPISLLSNQLKTISDVR